jgi:hypothetical protein
MTNKSNDTYPYRDATTAPCTQDCLILGVAVAAVPLYSHSQLLDPLGIGLKLRCRKETNMARMTPEEFEKKYGAKTPELQSAMCQQLCHQWENDFDIWISEGSPEHGTMYLRLQADVAALNRYHCRCTPQ